MSAMESQEGAICDGAHSWVVAGMWPQESDGCVVETTVIRNFWK